MSFRASGVYGGRRGPGAVVTGKDVAVNVTRTEYRGGACHRSPIDIGRCV